MQEIDKKNSKAQIINKRLVYSIILVIFFAADIGMIFSQESISFFKGISIVLYGIAILIFLIPLIRIQIINRKYRTVQPLMKITSANVIAVKKIRSILKVIYGIGAFFIVLMVWVDFKDGVPLVEAIIEDGDIMMNAFLLLVILSASYNFNETIIYEEGILSLIYFSKWENIAGYRWQKYPNKKEDSYALQLKLKKSSSKKESIFSPSLTIWVENKQRPEITKLMEERNIPHRTYM